MLTSNFLTDAMLWQYKVHFAVVIDLQLMRLASHNGYGVGRRGSSRPSLEVCLLEDVDIEAEERIWVAEAKTKGKNQWRPRDGGRLERFNNDPLHEDIIN